MMCLPTWPLELARPFGNFSVFDSSKQARVVVDEGAENDELGLDRVVGAVRPVIRHAGDASAVVAVDAVAHGAGDQLEIAGGVGLRQLGHEDARLRADVAAERLAEAAIGAARPAVDRPARGSRAATRTGDSRACGRPLRTARRTDRPAAAAADSRAGAAPRTDCRRRPSCPADCRPCRTRRARIRPVVERLELGIAQRPVGERSCPPGWRRRRSARRCWSGRGNRPRAGATTPSRNARCRRRPGCRS